MLGKIRHLLGRGLLSLGVDLRRTLTAIRGVPIYRRHRKEIERQIAAHPSPEFPLAKSYYCLEDWFHASGAGSGDYFHQDLLVAQRIFQNRPQQHVDIGSRVDGFVTHVAAYREIEVFDIRPQVDRISTIRFTQADLMEPIPERLVDYTDSLSCLHAIEHFGLGRYGDPLNYDGHLLGLENMHRILKSGGKFYFSTPIGPQRIEFNAHRVFSVAYLLRQFEGKYRIDRFSYVDDQGHLHDNVEMTPERIANNFGCTYNHTIGCGIFEMTKL